MILEAYKTIENIDNDLTKSKMELITVKKMILFGRQKVESVHKIDKIIERIDKCLKSL